MWDIESEKLKEAENNATGTAKYRTAKTFQSKFS
jgi:hypothetical protein